MELTVKHALASAMLFSSGFMVSPSASANAPSCAAVADADEDDCGSLAGHWSVGHEAATADSSVQRRVRGRVSNLDVEVGKLSVSRVIDRTCGEDCEAEDDLPESVEVKLTASLTWSHGIANASNWVTATYAGPGSMAFDLPPHRHHEINTTHYVTRSTTVALNLDEVYRYSLGAETFVELARDIPRDAHPDVAFAWTSATLSLSAEIENPNFEITCVPIPEPQTSLLMAGGLAVLGGGRAYRRWQVPGRRPG